MKKDDIDKILNSMNMPDPEKIKHQQDLKIPLLSYKKSSRAGLLLLIIPVVAAVTFIFRYELGISSPLFSMIRNFFAAIDKNQILTYLIPVFFIGFPLFAMIVNLLAFCHFSYDKSGKELLITLKYRPLNIIIFLFSFAVIIFFLLPDRLSF